MIENVILKKLHHQKEGFFPESKEKDQKNDAEKKITFSRMV